MLLFKPAIGVLSVLVVVLCISSTRCDVSHLLGGESAVDSGTIEVLRRNISDYLVELEHGGMPSMQLKQIYSASKQIVTGTLYTVQALLQTPQGSQKCEIKVLEKDWIDFCQVRVNCERGGFYEVTFNPSHISQDVSNELKPFKEYLPPSVYHQPETQSFLSSYQPAKPAVSFAQNPFLDTFPQTHLQEEVKLPAAPAYTPSFSSLPTLPAQQVTINPTHPFEFTTPVQTPVLQPLQPLPPLKPFEFKQPIYQPQPAPTLPPLKPLPTLALFKQTPAFQQPIGPAFQTQQIYKPQPLPTLPPLKPLEFKPQPITPVYQPQPLPPLKPIEFKPQPISPVFKPPQVPFKQQPITPVYKPQPLPSLKPIEFKPQPIYHLQPAPTLPPLKPLPTLAPFKHTPVYHQPAPAPVYKPQPLPPLKPLEFKPQPITPAYKPQPLPPLQPIEFKPQPVYHPQPAPTLPPFKPIEFKPLPQLPPQPAFIPEYKPEPIQHDFPIQPTYTPLQPKPELNVLPEEQLPQGDALEAYLQNLFREFMVKYQREYIAEPSEMAYRYDVFKGNFHTMHEHSRSDRLACQYSVTEFADLTTAEFERILGWDTSLLNVTDIADAEIPGDGYGLGDGQGRSAAGGEGDEAGAEGGEAPEHYDQREHNLVTRVKFQGDCGACWAFVTTACIEGLCAKRIKKLQEFSEQSLIDCDNSNYGCKGGVPPNALKHIAKRGGLELETSYAPYAYSKQTCRFDPKTVRVKVAGAIKFKKNDEVGMAKWLFKNGPIIVGVNADPLKYYKGGVLNPTPALCNPKKINHGVTLIGYGVEKNTSTGERLPYWIVKNQWGTQWGEDGFFRIARGKNACGLALWAYSAKLSNVPNNCELNGA